MKIILAGSENTHEYVSGEILKKIFVSAIPEDTVGEISIASNVQLFGQKIRDVDLVIFGYIQNYSENIYTNSKKEPNTFNTKKVWINSFCITIELKEQDSSGVEMVGTNLKVHYGDGKSRDATSQSEDQKYSLINFFSANAPIVKFWVNNFIWLRNLSEQSIKSLTNGCPNNLLPSSFNFNDLIRKICEQTPPVDISPSVCLLSSLAQGKNSEPQQTFYIIKDYLFSTKPAINELSRKNVERITSRELRIDQNLRDSIGKKLIKISGRAGTGKTIKMLRIACELASDFNKRCLFLTYNRALVEDINRLLYLADVPDNFDKGSIQVRTIHEFVREIAIALGVINKEIYSPDKHIDLCESLSEYLKLNVITQEDVAALMKNRFELAFWDHVFVDESQDFNISEKYLLFDFFGYEKLIVADGVDQFIRGINKISWEKNIYVVKSDEKRSLRQKQNLAQFSNDYALSLNLSWKVELLPSLIGGSIFISNELFPYNLIKKCRDLSYENGNSGFDILFLTPPNYVGKIGESSEFKFIKEFEFNGIQLWDGTNKKSKNYGYGDLSRHRLIQYDSCRGLEGWCVVCLGFDKLIDYKLKTFDFEIDDEALIANKIMMDKNEAKKHFVDLWTLIPLTRAIDTLIITLENPDNLTKIFLREILENDCVRIV